MAKSPLFWFILFYYDFNAYYFNKSQQKRDAEKIDIPFR